MSGKVGADKKFLTLLFFNASCGVSSECCENRRLGNLYETVPEMSSLWGSLHEKLVSLGVENGTEDICDELDELREAHELQGFINGFRLCAMLWGDLEGGPQRK